MRACGFAISTPSTIGRRAGSSREFSDLTLQLENEPVEPLSASFPRLLGDSSANPFLAKLLTALDGTTSQLYERFGFNTSGQVRVDVGLTLDNRILPRHFLDDAHGWFSVDQWGGSHLQSLKLQSRLVLVATGWQLPDGADADMQVDLARGGGQAGQHEGGSMHALRLQVNRLSHLGVAQDIEDAPGLSSLMKVFAIALPSPFTSTFVAAHNYGLADGDPHQCASGPGSHDLSHEAKDGLNNLDTDSSLDHPWRKCFDTAPFRDVSGYDSGGEKSLYARQFQARGAFFLGCPNAMADDPTAAGSPDSSRGDRNTQQLDCGGGG